MPNASTSRIHALKVAVADGLGAVGALSGVQIASVPLGDEVDRWESIQLDGSDEIEQDWAHVGRFSRHEVITLSGFIAVMKPGAGETVARTARERAAALLAEIEGFVVADPSISNTVLTSKIRPTRLSEGYSGEGRWALLFFEIRAETRLTTS